MKYFKLKSRHFAAYSSYKSMYHPWMLKDRFYDITYQDMELYKTENTDQFYYENAPHSLENISKFQRYL